MLYNGGEIKMVLETEHGRQRPQKLNSLKSLKIQNSLAPKPDIFTPTTIRIGFLIKF